MHKNMVENQEVRNLKEQVKILTQMVRVVSAKADILENMNDNLQAQIGQIVKYLGEPVVKI
jgi:hypothetical protein